MTCPNLRFLMYPIFHFYLGYLQILILFQYESYERFKMNIIIIVDLYKAVINCPLKRQVKVCLYVYQKRM